jgi:PilZ domain
VAQGSEPSSVATTDQLPNIEQTNRSSTRVRLALPVRVKYLDSETSRRMEMACTYDISGSGARIVGLLSAKTIGELVAIERGRSRALCRVVWIGEPDSDLRGQVGLECVKNDCIPWERELREMEEVYDPILLELKPLRVGFSFGQCPDNRRRYERFNVVGAVQIMSGSSPELHPNAILKNISEVGCLLTTSGVLPEDELKLGLKVESCEVFVRGQIRHAHPEDGIGIQFMAIRRGDRERLKFLLAQLVEREFEKTFEVEV